MPVPTQLLRRLGATLLLPLAFAANADTTAPQDLKFAEFFGPVGRAGLTMTPRLVAANGTRVRITGYMVAEEDAPTGRFFLTPRPVRMSEHADGEADDLPPTTVVVLMPAGDSTRPIAHNAGLMQLTGTLQVGRRELADGRVSWVRLQLEPQEKPSLTVSGVSP